jgi:hypothetical protein
MWILDPDPAFPSQFNLIEKIKKNISAVNFFSFWSTTPWIRIRIENKAG